LCWSAAEPPKRFSRQAHDPKKLRFYEYPDIQAAAALPQLTLMLDPEAENYREVYNASWQVANALRGERLAVVILPADMQSALKFFKVKVGDLPTAMVVNWTNGLGERPYQLFLHSQGAAPPLAKTPLLEFSQHFLQGEVPQWRRSAPVVSDWELALDDGKDVLVMFFAPWCGFSKRMSPRVDELARHFRYARQLSILKIDDTQNDVDHPVLKQMKGYPFLAFFPAGKKNDAVPVRVNGRLLGDSEAWLKEAAQRLRALATVELLETAPSTEPEEEASGLLTDAEETGRSAMPATAWKEVVIDGKVKFKVPAHLELIKKVGSGAYGTVASFQDPKSGTKLAVKKITDAFHDLVDGKRILREVKLLRSFRHDNIISILDMYPPDHPDFDDIYIVTDLMETDLHRVIYSKQVLNDEHHQYFSYQILRGLLYLHSANVVHRDLKPANILVNKNCDLKICDFGLARGLGNDEDDPTLTDYVVTRWYRAPEVVLLASEYTKSIDVWSVGCILCELIGRKPIFTGKDHLDQIKKILAVVGMPSEEDLTWLPPRSPARNFIKKVPPCTKQSWKSVYPKATEAGIYAIERMLTFNPTKRATIPECLILPYYETLHMPDDEPVAETPVDWAFDKFTPTKRLLQNYIYAECWKFHPEIQQRDAKLLDSRGISELLR
ncbi:MMK1, partial [Symbiodinium necroappetens]